MSHTRASGRATRRRTSIIIGALAALIVFGAGVVGTDHLTRPSKDTESTTARQAVPPSGSVAPGPAPDQVFGAGAAGSLGLAGQPISLRYTFDGGPGVPVTDDGGLFPLRAVTQAGGALSFAAVPNPPAGSAVPGVIPGAPRANGFAVEFPPRCRRAPKACPRAILEGARNDALNPGIRPLQYGASVLMSAADTGDGANVIQKGYSVGGGSQFKLQVDHEQGNPSCVIADGSEIYRVQPGINVADGAWHTIVCTRTGTLLGITVDGVAMDSVFVPPSLSIVNAEPLRVGGKGAGAGNDQFAGQLDNVFLTIS